MNPWGLICEVSWWNTLRNHSLQQYMLVTYRWFIKVDFYLQGVEDVPGARGSERSPLLITGCSLWMIRSLTLCKSCTSPSLCYPRALPPPTSSSLPLECSISLRSTRITRCHPLSLLTIVLCSRYLWWLNQTPIHPIPLSFLPPQAKMMQSPWYIGGTTRRAEKALE